MFACFIILCLGFYFSPTDLLLIYYSFQFGMFMGYLCVQIMCMFLDPYVFLMLSLWYFLFLFLCLFCPIRVCLSVFYLFFLSFSPIFGTVPVFYLERVRKGVYWGGEFRENMEVVGEVENVIRRNYEKYIFNKSMQL